MKEVTKNQAKAEPKTRITIEKKINPRVAEKKKIDKTKKLVNIHKRIGKIIKKKKELKHKDVMSTLEKIQLKLLSVIASF